MISLTVQFELCVQLDVVEVTVTGSYRSWEIIPNGHSFNYVAYGRDSWRAKKGRYYTNEMKSGERYSK